jgi:hypothetical protein
LGPTANGKARSRVFSQPIVFIVGAGASSEFGLPVSGQMNANISRTLNFGRGPDGLLIGNRQLYDMLGSRFGPDHGKYTDAAAELATTIREFDTIDEALHWFSARPEIVSLGKVAIVQEILSAENQSKLFNAQDPRIIRV